MKKNIFEDKELNKEVLESKCDLSSILVLNRGRCRSGEAYLTDKMVDIMYSTYPVMTKIYPKRFIFAHFIIMISVLLKLDYNLDDHGVSKAHIVAFLVEGLRIYTAMPLSDAEVNFLRVACRIIAKKYSDGDDAVAFDWLCTLLCGFIFPDEKLARWRCLPQYLIKKGDKCNTTVNAYIDICTENSLEGIS